MTKEQKIKLLEQILSKEIDMVANREIYDHGYPEARLIPSNFYDDSLDIFAKEIKEEINDLIDDILHDANV